MSNAIYNNGLSVIMHPFTNESRTPGELCKNILNYINRIDGRKNTTKMILPISVNLHSIKYHIENDDEDIIIIKFKLDGSKYLDNGIENVLSSIIKTYEHYTDKHIVLCFDIDSKLSIDACIHDNNILDFISTHTVKPD